MANEIRIKRRLTGNAGAPSQLRNAELAFNEVDSTLYYGKGINGEYAAEIIAIAGSGAYVSLSGAQTITGVKTFTQNIIGNLTGNASTASALETARTISATGDISWSVTFDGSSNVSQTATINNNVVTNAKLAQVSTGTVKGRKSSGTGNVEDLTMEDLAAMLLGGSGTVGTVRSVGLSMPSDIFDVSGSPITDEGTFTVTKKTQSANTVFAGPAGGTAAVPTFRALVADDIPSLTASKISDFDSAVRLNRLDQMAIPQANLNMNNYRITGLAAPVNSGDAATKSYVDATVQGLDVKNSVRVCASTNINLSSPGTTIDGITLAVGDRVLVKGQTNKAQNGIYVFNGSNVAMTRAADADSNDDVTSGLFTFVEEGTCANHGYVLITDNPIELGTTELEFAQFSGAGMLEAGDGLYKVGNTIHVGVASTSRIVVSENNIDLATTGITAGTYFKTTVDAYGRVTAGENPTTLAGFGITDALSTSTEIATNNGITGGGLISSGLTLGLTGQALALHNLNTNGIFVRTGASTVAARTITGTVDRISVTNGDGVSGNPVIDIASTYVGQTSITTLGTITTGTWQGSVIGAAYGGTGANLSSADAGSLFKMGTGGSFVVATVHVDYLNNQSSIDGGTF